MMYGFDINVDDVTLEPIEINGTVYVPYHVSNGQEELTTFVEYERMIAEHGIGESDDDNDFRVDGDLR
jgi:hypothetical protein